MGQRGKPLEATAAKMSRCRALQLPSQRQLLLLLMELHWLKQLKPQHLSPPKHASVLVACLYSQAPPARVTNSVQVREQKKGS